MAIVPLNKDEIRKMERACRLAAETLNYVEKYIRAGLSTDEIDKLVHDFTLSRGAVPAPLGYNGFPKSVCTSINEVICHGLPGGEILRDGDIINVDVTPKLDGFYGDSSRTFLIGNVSDKARDLVEVAKLAMEKGIEAITPGGRTGDIGFETNKIVTRRGYTAVKEIGGHGVGRIFHEEPFVPSWGKKGKGDRLVPFHCITVEPMVNEGTDEIIEHDIPGSAIKWYTTADKKLSAQFEHTVLVTDTGYEVLTLA
ncbi:MAG: type I methionyl aminopeptidase [Bdellovibrionaceae bacterium]|nr:type I methionyl aminopeptidase [Pseudobdellovibrionaceae bacterium]MBX3035185.1 type I methionyl aminopeptidase [Pseudobdellovibrionaceae bacterium]